MVGAAPGAGRAAVGLAELGAVVAAEDEQGVLAQAEPVDLVRDLAHAMVHLHHGVGKVALAGAAREIRMRQRGKVQVHQGQVQKEAAVPGVVAAHEVQRALHQLGIDVAPRF